MGQDALDLETDKRIRKHQGCHKATLCRRGEAGLHQHYRGCYKNPGHRQFIPICDFKIDHLPHGYHDNDIVDWIRAVADLTCRLSVRHTSLYRPKFHPGCPLSLYPFYQDRGSDWMRIGTGWVGHVDMYTKRNMKNCECEECCRPGTHTPKKVWGQIYINTASHVVYDSDEARCTTCHFFYNTSATHLTRCLTLTGLSMKFSDVEGDWAVMKYATHDVELLDRLHKIWRRWLDLCDKVWKKYHLNNPEYSSVSREVHDINKNCKTCVIISHPHGCSKMLSMGMWTWRQTSEDSMEEFGDHKEYDIVGTEYKYDTPTCPGSSGAPVITLPPGRERLDMSHHLHSEGKPGNDNKSAMRKFVIDPSRSVVEVEHTLDTTEPLSHQDRGNGRLRIINGRVGLVDTERGMDNCGFKLHSRPGTHMAKIAWEKDNKNTAHHVVYYSDEARHTTRHSFYDTSTTHKCHHWFVHCKKVGNQLQLSNPEYHGVSREVCDPCVAISHPNGCSKQLSVGMCSCKQRSNGSREKFDGNNDKGNAGNDILSAKMKFVLGPPRSVINVEHTLDKKEIVCDIFISLFCYLQSNEVSAYFLIALFLKFLCCLASIEMSLHIGKTHWCSVLLGSSALSVLTHTMDKLL